MKFYFQSKPKFKDFRQTERQVERQTRRDKKEGRQINRSRQEGKPADGQAGKQTCRDIGNQQCLSFVIKIFVLS